MNIRLKDIAKEAGVSISTVSRVLNNPYTTAAGHELQEQIWAIVRKTGYSPNREAQLLKQGKTTPQPTKKLLHCLIPCSAEEVKYDSFYTQILSAIEREAYSNDMALVSTYFARDLEEPETVRRILENPKDNLIIIGRFKPKILEVLNRGFKRIVYTGLNDLNISCDQILCDGFQAIREAVHYLHSQGHTQLALIGNAADHEARCLGYFAGMKELGLLVNERNIIANTVLSLDGGRRGLIRLSEQGFDATAVICANDMVAMGVLHACKSLRIRVPMDLSVLGMNDIETVQYVTPMLTSIHVPMDEMGKVAVRILLDRLNGGHSLPLKVCLPFHIVKRESTGVYS